MLRVFRRVVSCLSAVLLYKHLIYGITLINKPESFQFFRSLITIRSSWTINCVVQDTTIRNTAIYRNVVGVPLSDLNCSSADSNVAMQYVIAQIICFEFV